MRARRAMWMSVSGLVLALAVGVVLLSPKPGGITVHAVGQTNGYAHVFVTNGTAQLQFATAWGEFYRNDAWERLAITNAFHRLEPGSFVDFGVPMPTNAPKRVACVCQAVPTSGLPKWIDVARARLRLKPKVERMYIAIE